MRQGISFLVALLLCLTPTPGFAGGQKQKKKHSDPETIGRRDINKGSLNFYSLESEVALGEELARNVVRTSRLLDDPLVTQYLTRVADRIGRHSDLRMPLRVRVLDSDEINAFALPGGHFFATTGLLLETRSEAELASVIAHEIAHAAARHATKQMSRLRLWNWLSIPLLFLGGPVAYGIQQGLAIAVPLSFLKFSRNAEREADFLGQQYQYASGYDPVAFMDFFERMKQKQKGERGGIAKVFSTHPMTRDRVVAAERNIEQYLPPQEEYVVTTSEFDDVRAYLANLIGERRREEEARGLLLHRRESDDWPRRGGPGKW